MKSAAILFASTGLACAGSATTSHPVESWEWTLESGYLWNVGHNTDIGYEIIPTQLTLRSPWVAKLWTGESGDLLTLRSRYSLLMEAITVGPEDYSFGFNCAPSLEYWFPDATTSLFFSIGGGAGWTNSAGGTDGQGQDLHFNWFTNLGVRREIAENISLLGGVYFIHHSNLGITDPNPGIDALGFTLGCGWTF